MYGVSSVQKVSGKRVGGKKAFHERNGVMRLAAGELDHHKAFLVRPYPFSATADVKAVKRLLPLPLSYRGAASLVPSASQDSKCLVIYREENRG